MENIDIFKSEKRESTVDYVINTIKKLLLTKKLKPGDILPSEAVLSDSLKVSRGSIREAMKILSAFGIVEIKRGNGTYICDSFNKSFIDPFLFNLIFSGPDTAEIVELREMLECQVVTLVIKNALEQDIEGLEQVHLEMKHLFEETAGSETKGLIAYELKFHEALGHATKNVLVEKIYSFVMELFAPYIEKTYDYEKNGTNAILLHEGIVKSIKARDIIKAVEATQKSIEEWRLLFDENH